MVNPPLDGCGSPSPSPYRQLGDARRHAMLSIRYWPRVTLWPLLLAVLVAMPIAWGLRQESRTPSTVTCSTAADNELAPACFVRDARKISPPQRLACEDTLPALETLLDAQNPFARPHVSATVLTTPEIPLPPVLTSTPSFTINGAPAVVMTKPGSAAHPRTGPKSKPLPTPAIDASGGISTSDARSLLTSCVAQAGSRGEVQHVTLSVFERDFLLSGVAFASLLLLAVLWMVGRRVVVRSDGTGTGVVEIIESGYFTARRRSSFTANQVERAVVTTGSSGPFHATRIDILCNGGEKIAITSDFTPMARKADTRLVSRLNILFASVT